jgi:hypothetical protein
MTTSRMADETFDVVIDKAAMDAMMAVEGDVWNPSQICVDQARYMSTRRESWFRVVTFLQISPGVSSYIRLLRLFPALVDRDSHELRSFATYRQTHFRKLYLLLGWHRSATVDRSTIRIRTSLGHFSCRHGQQRIPPADAFGHFLSWPKRDDRQSSASCIYLFCT